MSNIKIDKNTIESYEKSWIKKIKIYFYEAGCSGTKLMIESEFEIDDDVEKLESSYPFEIYVEKKDVERFENCSITRTIISDHTGKEKLRYIFTSWLVKQRCGCGSSFNFSEKKLTLNLENLKKFKNTIN